MKSPINKAAYKRLMQNVTKDKTGCWLWNGTKNPQGYGQLSFNRESISAHRLMFRCTNGKDAPEFVCHKCDVPSCINPKHLYAGSRKDNARDAAERKRFAYGLRNGNGKIAPKTVSLIRENWVNGSKLRELAKQFNIPIGTIWDICSYRWRKYG